MLDRENLTRYINDFQRLSLPDAVERELGVPATKKILSIFGPRRCGKSYYFYQLMRRIEAEGAGRERILCLNFDDTRLADLTFKDIEGALRLHLELNPGAIGRELYVFLDEPQNIPDWERAVRSLDNKGDVRLFITGSSAKLLSQEIATALRGRTISYLLLPYSFREFLAFRGLAGRTISNPGTGEEARMKALLSEHLHIGGFPEVVKEPDESVRMKILTEYYQLIIYRDIVERYGIENLTFIKFLLGQLFSGFSREMSAHKIYSTAKSRGFEVSKKTAYDYICYIEDALAVFLLRRWAASPRTRETSLPKVYIADNGFARLFPSVSDNRGFLAENAVFLELRRAQNMDPLLEVYYWKDKTNGLEVDFALRKDGRFIRLMQVCHSIDEPRTLKREARALIAAGRELGCRRLTILEWDREGKESIEGFEIEIKPLWKWFQGPVY